MGLMRDQNLLIQIVYDFGRSVKSAADFAPPESSAAFLNPSVSSRLNSGLPAGEWMLGIPGGPGCGERGVVQQWAFVDREDASASANDLQRQRRECAKFIWKLRHVMRA